VCCSFFGILYNSLLFQNHAVDIEKHSWQTDKRTGKENSVRVTQYFKLHKEKYKMDYITQSTSEATGISISSVKRILKEGRQILVKILHFQCRKRRKLPQRNEQNLTASRNLWCEEKFTNFVLLRKNALLLKKILQDLEKDNILHCSKVFLQKNIRETEFKWKKFQSKRRLLVEKPDIAAWRGSYLQALKKF
jgi:hypothetical protein